MAPSQPRRQPNEAFDFDGSYGSEYAAFAARVIPAYEQTFELGFTLLEDQVGPDARVLVAGCGAGADLVTFARHAPGWTLTGVDPSPQMVTLAEARLRAEGLGDRCTLHRAFVSDLPPDRTYDAATLYNVLHFLPDDGAKLGLLASIAERLRPSGVLVMIDLHGDRGAAQFAATDRAWRRFIRLHGIPDARIDEFFRQLDAGIHWVPEDRILTLLAEAGFGAADRFFHALHYGGWVARR